MRASHLISSVTASVGQACAHLFVVVVFSSPGPCLSEDIAVCRDRLELQNETSALSENLLRTYAEKQSGGHVMTGNLPLLKPSV